MGYNIFLFPPNVRTRVKAGEDFEEFEHPALDRQAVADFIAKLMNYGYKQESVSPHQEFLKDVDGCPIQVTIFETEISFSIPYWGNANAAIFDALMDASEIIDSDFFVMYDPQSGEWS